MGRALQTNSKGHHSCNRGGNGWGSDSWQLRAPAGEQKSESLRLTFVLLQPRQDQGASSSSLLFCTVGWRQLS